MKFNTINIDRKGFIKINKIFNEHLKEWFTEGKTYPVTAIRYDHNDNYEWTTSFRCWECDKAGFATINEFEADFELI